MKKVKNILSAAFSKVSAKRCAAAFSAAVVAVTSVTCIVQLAFDRQASAQTSSDSISSREILELSESYLSQNADRNFSMLELSGKFSSFDETECESINLIEELSTGSEREKDTKEEVTTEKETKKAPETTTKVEKTTKAETTTVAATPAVATTEREHKEGGYTFDELGIKQMSDIEVPDDILFDENGIPVNYRYTISGKSTTYTMGTTTATGTKVHPGVVAVNPKIIPYGTKMYIVANDGSGYVYGYSSAEDTGGFIYWDNGPLVDLYVYTYADSCYWGNKPVTIYVF